MHKDVFNNPLKNFQFWALAADFYPKEKVGLKYVRRLNRFCFKKSDDLINVTYMYVALELDVVLFERICLVTLSLCGYPINKRKAILSYTIYLFL